MRNVKSQKFFERFFSQSKRLRRPDQNPRMCVFAYNLGQTRRFSLLMDLISSIVLELFVLSSTAFSPIFTFSVVSSFRPCAALPCLAAKLSTRTCQEIALSPTFLWFSKTCNKCVPDGNVCVGANLVSFSR